jgi:hypothetical protein
VKDKGLTLEEVMARRQKQGHPHVGWVARARTKTRLAANLGILFMGFGSMALRIRALRDVLLDADSLAKYLDLVDKVPRKAPHAMDVPAYRAGLTGQGHILKMLSLFKQAA